ncbi:hypothetical protein [Undibacterium pigrum]|uniref:Uncharacterized protein n=1 Tax=Undibacterium pigrum TaxID=401470 RepID=A0A318IVC9_9BURK|nr:hypothetical protein [Undibacterium pigrum]PXX38570.1 hypothetical protein DFR42_11282 [Undibacterium pigrum]
MGLSAIFYVVTDWDYIANQPTEKSLADAFDKGSSYLRETLDVHARDGIAPHWCYLYQEDTVLEYWKFAWRAGSDTYSNVIRPLLDDLTRRRADACLQALFWHGEDCDLHQQCDLEKAAKFTGCNEGLIVSVKPENVEYLHVELKYLMQKVRLPDIRQACGAAPESDYTCSWQTWVDYLERWQALLSEAKSKNAGILVEAT